MMHNIMPYLDQNLYFWRAVAVVVVAFGTVVQTDFFVLPLEQPPCEFGQLSLDCYLLSLAPRNSEKTMYI